MSRLLKAAVVQMDATPAPLTARLNRAAELVRAAAEAGAQIVVLPELFNSGYRYDEHNYDLAETLEGETVGWMKAQAAEHGIHLAGTLLLRNADDIYNAALLFAPDGRLWRYDKVYPFAWERAYFRPGQVITVAETDLGKLGMLICWDASHSDLWERYAGQVEAMLVMSCAPKISAMTIAFPNGERANMRELSGLWDDFYTPEEYFTGIDLDAHAAWLGVPVIATQGSGQFDSPVPWPRLTTATLVMGRPDLWDNALMEGSQIRFQAGFDPQTKIVDAGGQVLGRVTTGGDGYVLTEIALPDSPPQPQTPPPLMHTSPVAYLFADIVTPALAGWDYIRTLRLRWGPQAAPLTSRRRFWLSVGIITALITLVSALKSSQKK
jgi:predicted amidohydrolase